MKFQIFLFLFHNDHRWILKREGAKKSKASILKELKNVKEVGGKWKISKVGGVIRASPPIPTYDHDAFSS